MPNLGVLEGRDRIGDKDRGSYRLYRLDADQMKPVHDWMDKYDYFWAHQFDRLKERAERKAAERMAELKTLIKDKEE